MLNKYFQIFNLLQELIKKAEFEDKPFSYPVLSGHQLIGSGRMNGFNLGVFSNKHTTNIFSIQTLNADYFPEYKSCTTNAKNSESGCANIKGCEYLHVWNYNDLSLQLSPNIDLSTGEGDDEIFQLSTIHPNNITNMFALSSHFKNHGIDNLYSLSYIECLPESAIDILISKLKEINEEFYK